jgi:hypothetical protein
MKKVRHLPPWCIVAHSHNPESELIGRLDVLQRCQLMIVGLENIAALKKSLLEGLDNIAALKKSLLERLDNIAALKKSLLERN